MRKCKVNRSRATGWFNRCYCFACKTRYVKTKGTMWVKHKITGEWYILPESLIQ